MPEVRGKKEMTEGRFSVTRKIEVGGQKFVVVVRLMVIDGKKKIRRTVPLIYWR